MLPKKRVLILIKGLGLGGAEKLLSASLPYLNRDEFEYEIAYLLPWKDTLVAEIEQQGIQVICLGAKFAADIRPFWKLMKLIKNREYDIVHTHLPLTGIMGRIAAWRNKVDTIVYTEHGSWNRLHWLTRFVNRMTLGLNDLTIAVSDDVARSMNLKKDNSVQTIVNGVDCQAFKTIPDESVAVRTELEIPEDHFVVGKVANFLPVKNHEMLLRAFAKFQQSVPQSTLVLVGQLRGRDQLLLKLARSLKIDKNIIMTGPRTDALRLMRSFDIFVMSSLSEGLPISLLEAMALSKPVVCTQVGGIPGVVTEGVEGFLVPTDDETAMATRLVDLFQNREQRHQMGQAACLRVNEHFNIADMVHNVEQKYLIHLKKKRAKTMTLKSVSSGKKMAIEPIENKNRKTSIPALFVDLDGTLVTTDIFLESLLLAIKKCPILLLCNLYLLLWDRAALKRLIANKVTPDVSLLPYNKDVISYIHNARANGVQIILATASDQYWAESIASYLNLFDDVLASNGHINLKGAKKLESIEKYCLEYEIPLFSYIGNSKDDIPIWKKADYKIVVTNSQRFLRNIHKQACEPNQIIKDQITASKEIASIFRPKQWVKNLLLVLPLILSHLVFDAGKLTSVLVAFISFCFCASSIYVINDLLDIESDRRHPIKKKRPFALGSLPVVYGPSLAIVFAGMGIGTSVLFLPVMFTFILLVYLSITTLYSFWLKRKLMIDVIVLASLYTIRILAGGAAAGVAVSEWLICFSMFLFTSLAFAKRYSELKRLENNHNEEVPHGRGYRVSDSSIIEMMGQTCGFLSVLVLALYIQSDKVKLLYGEPKALWLLCPILLYWIGRLWVLAHRGVLTEDPVAFTATDRKSWIIAILSGVILIYSIQN